MKERTREQSKRSERSRYKRRAFYCLPSSERSEEAFSVLHLPSLNSTLIINTKKIKTKKTPKKHQCDNSARAAAAIADAWQSGVEPIPVSALSGSGSGDLLDAVLDALPETRPRKRVASTGTEAETVSFFP